MGGTASKANKITPLSAADNSKLLQQQNAQQQQLEDVKQQIYQLHDELESDKQQNAQLQQELESSKQQITQLQQQLESCKQQYSASLLHGDKQQFSQLHDEFESGKQQNAQLQQQLENSKQQIAQLQQQLESGKQRNGQLQQRVENDQLSTAADQFARDISNAAQRKDEAFMREIFNRHATKEKISASALIAALKEVAAPVLAAASSEGSCDTADYVFRRADADLSGDVDFSE